MLLQTTIAIEYETEFYMKLIGTGAEERGNLTIIILYFVYFFFT